MRVEADEGSAAEPPTCCRSQGVLVDRQPGTVRDDQHEPLFTISKPCMSDQKVVRRRPDAAGGKAGDEILRDHGSPPGFDLDEGEPPTTAGDQIDLARVRSEAVGEDTIALQPKTKRHPELGSQSETMSQGARHCVSTRVEPAGGVATTMP